MNHGHHEGSCPHCPPQPYMDRFARQRLLDQDLEERTARGVAAAQRADERAVVLARRQALVRRLASPIVYGKGAKLDKILAGDADAASVYGSLPPSAQAEWRQAAAAVAAAAAGGDRVAAHRGLEELADAHAGELIDWEAPSSPAYDPHELAAMIPRGPSGLRPGR